MKVVEFLHPNGIYGVGDVAGFETAIAERLVSLGVAKWHVESKPRKTLEDTDDKQVAPARRGFKYQTK